MKFIFSLIFIIWSVEGHANPVAFAQKHIGQSMLDNYLRKPLTQVIKLIEGIPENKKKIMGRSFLLNLYGHNFDTTIVHDGHEVISFTRVFYEEENAAGLYKEIEKMGKKEFKRTVIPGGAMPGSFYDYDFKSRGVFFRFDVNKKIQIITIKKITRAVKT